MARTPRTAVPPPPPEPVASGLPALPRRSLGLKLLLVCALAFLMSIPAMMVFGLLMDRSNRAESVATEIGALMGGPQTFLGPVIALPYTQPQSVLDASNGETPAPRATQGLWYIFPTEGRVEAATESEVRRRSLFRVTVYDARLDYRATFDMEAAARDLPAGAVPDWSRAEIVLGASDARGARADLTLVLPDRTATLTPSKLDSTVSLNPSEAPSRRSEYATGSELKLFGTPLTATDRAAGVTGPIPPTMAASCPRSRARRTSPASRRPGVCPSSPGAYPPRAHRSTSPVWDSRNWASALLNRPTPISQSAGR